MRTKLVLFVLLLSTCLTLFGQQSKTSTAAKPTMQELSSTIDNQQKEIIQLKDENNCLKQQLDTFEKEVELLKSKEDFIDDKLSHWLTILSIVIGAIIAFLGVGLGVIAPIFINRKNDKKQKEQIENIKKELEEKITNVQAQAEKAASSLSSVEKINEDINTIKADIENSKKEAEQAAINAKASELFSQALKEEDDKKAINLYTEYLKLVSGYEAGVALFYRSDRKDNIGDYEGEIEDLTKALESQPNESSIYYNRANSKRNIGDLNGAIIDYDKAIELNPKHAASYNNRGSIKKQIGDTEGALSDYNNSILYNPKNALAYNNRGDLFNLIGDTNKAKADINKAIELDPNMAVSYITKGEICINTLVFDEAINCFSKALSCNDIKPNEKKLALSKRAVCFREQAKDKSNEESKDLINKAIEDEKEASTI